MADCLLWHASNWCEPSHLHTILALTDEKKDRQTPVFLTLLRVKITSG
jgi:hypothetical protein